MLEKFNEFFADGTWVDSVVPFLINVLVAIAIYIVGKWIASHIVKLIDKGMELRKMDPVLRGFLTAILGTAFTFVVILIAVEQLGINTTSLLALLGAAGLAVGLALKDSLSNFAAGVMLILFKPFKIGDFVEAGGVSGIVEKIEVFNTIFRSGDNKEIIVPNAQIYGGTITNYSARATRRIDLVIGIGYDDDMKKARDLMLEVLNADERVLQDPAPVVAVNELGDSSVNFVVRPWVASGDYWPTRWALLEAIKNTFDANGVSIPYPQQDVHMHQVEK
ncbi:mechanosensitive ion channel family protein [Marinagarivorans cellulosilyticus]|uniref:Small-conductance mechanosensitive channel n=1 Tax=Marinagarivorans cellulosilyticus TaxID=2721545 RepID=A0AAN1WI40_9GAMM|nr:mechanosensitive ion channel domain-containing protein [Marinagarivorans cellulosilyticus]BCD97992.1 small conductance mechanosensitive channel [Marinagarivorans cellulosilyticus]